ncbi:hypothetical protein THAOC_16037 [Thalassiosira oceanica]|uniref:MYND-type domain-containing protein n=1 Tax=Thalassiosira oceanica TaxID=159749 RepID=K0SEB7_THAOC|nr:hypothetical protein THAOC_16037 [Thalassiosira oceanica]|eukprot:EJK63309.1 hypothetical protein THAOC_16037 [Thalassiosira oceanica]
MSCAPVPTAEACANCGKEGSDAIKLKNCNACFLVKYCSVDCQKIHRKKHKGPCKKRAAELKDEKLYSQGHERAELDFCPLCLLAIPFPVPEADHAKFYVCCMKRVCNGCVFAALKCGLNKVCPFCRTSAPKNNEEALEKIQKRVDARDPEAICHLGDSYITGTHGLEKDKSRAFELWTEAAELGSTYALAKIGGAHYSGNWGASQDIAKGIHCWESAAMLGSVISRHGLGFAEASKGNHDRAMFALGLATKAQYAEALIGYQDALEEMRSPQRDEAAEFGYQRGKSDHTPHGADRTTLLTPPLAPSRDPNPADVVGASNGAVKCQGLELA